MHKLTLNIKDNAYSNIVYFLKKFSDDIEILSHKIIDDSTKKQDISSLGGALNKYANPSKMELEEGAWQLHVVEKYR